jgi:hypothetical protein
VPRIATRHRQEDEGHGKQGLDDAADHGVDPAALVAGQDAEKDPDEAAHHNGRDAYDERDARAPDDATEDVASLLVRAQPVGLSPRVDVAGRLEVTLEVLLQRVHGGQRSGNEGADHHDGAAEQANKRRRTAQQRANRQPESRGALAQLISRFDRPADRHRGCVFLHHPGLVL